MNLRVIDFKYLSHFSLWLSLGGIVIMHYSFSPSPISVQFASAAVYFSIAFN